MSDHLLFINRKMAELESELSLSLAREQRKERERNDWIKLFNRLDAAVSRHRQKGEWSDGFDDALHAAHDRVLKAAAQLPLSEHPGTDAASANSASCKPKEQDTSSVPDGEQR